MSNQPTTYIKVLGLGGGGSNAINRMLELGVEGVEFIAANTDAQALKLARTPHQVQLGPKLTRGLGAGGRPEVGQAAAEESRADLRRALEGADMVFMAAGLGGGTGTGAIPVAAQVARELGALTVAVVTLPFNFEATRRRHNAEQGLEKLRAQVDALVCVPNDRLIPLLGKNTRFDVALRVADEVLRQGVQGLVELITQPGLINVDFTHVRSVMRNSGTAMLAIGQGRGDNKALDALNQALRMPLVDNTHIENAQGFLVYFSGGEDLGLWEVSEATALLSQAAPNAQLIFGAGFDPLLTDRAQVILLATGLETPPTASTLVPTPVVTLAPAEKAAPASPPGAHLAEALFQQALENSARREQAAQAASEANNLDVPAFLRRRRAARTLNAS